jgi:hypothetical protein
VVRRAVLVIAALWVGRWLSLELGVWIDRRRPQGPPPIDSLRIPGRIPRRREDELGPNTAH